MQLPTSPPPPLHVLVADDDVFTQRLLVGLLQREGHHGVVVADGQRALDAIDAAAGAMPHGVAGFDLLLDVHMPGLDGVAALTRIRRAEHLDAVRTPLKIIMVTGHADPIARARLLMAGADGVLAKPLDPGRFSHLLDYVRNNTPHRPTV